jgi:hypothetical protein
MADEQVTQLVKTHDPIEAPIDTRCNERIGQVVASIVLTFPQVVMLTWCLSMS